MAETSLRDFLDAGGELRTETVPFFNLEDFAFGVVRARRRQSADQLRERAAAARAWAEGEAMVDARLAVMWLWEAEILEDPDLGDRFEVALPVDLFDQALAQANDVIRWQIQVDSVDVFECWACGESRIAESAVVLMEAGQLSPPTVAAVVASESASDLGAVICLDCIEHALARGRRQW